MSISIIIVPGRVEHLSVSNWGCAELNWKQIKLFNDRMRRVESGRSANWKWNLWAHDPCWVGLWCCNRFPLNHHRLLSYWIYGDALPALLKSRKSSAILDDVGNVSQIVKHETQWSSQWPDTCFSTFENRSWTFHKNLQLWKIQIWLMFVA